jgi:hypothetical protein
MNAPSENIRNVSAEHGPSNRTSGAAAPRRERNSTLVAAAPGVLIHRIGDDDASLESGGSRRRYEEARPRAARAHGASHGKTPPAYQGEVAETRTHQPGPAYTLPQSLRWASQRAKEVQPPLINMAGCDLS